MVVGGICGLDFYYYNYGGFGLVWLKEFMILGYEVLGYIIVFGFGVLDLSVG